MIILYKTALSCSYKRKNLKNLDTNDVPLILYHLQQYKEKLSMVEGKVFEPMNVPWEVIDACNGFALDIGKFNLISGDNYQKMLN